MTSFQDATHWFRQLLSNPYFWGGLTVLIGIGLIVLFVFNSLVMPSYTRYGTSIAVPDVEQQSFDMASQTLTQQGLAVEREEGRYNPNVPQGVVVDQTPPPNSSVKPGRRVYLTVNSGEAPTVVLPDLSGTSLREAENRLRALGLKVRSLQVDPIPSPYPNTITRQRPAPGDSLKQGKGVALWYSEGLGEETSRVPNLIGLRADRAQARLLDRKLRSVIINQQDDASEATEDDVVTSEELETDRLYVIRQDRTPGTSLRHGREVRLFAIPDSAAARQRREAIPSSGARRDTSQTSADTSQTPGANGMF